MWPRNQQGLTENRVKRNRLIGADGEKLQLWQVNKVKVQVGGAGLSEDKKKEEITQHK